MKSMDKIIMVFVVSALMVGMVRLCQADDVPLAWDKVVDPNCAGYVIQMSVDQGVTWTDVWDTGDPDVVTATINDVQSNALVLFRAASLNAAGDRFPTTYAGAWYDGSKRPVSPPGGVGVPAN